MKKAAYNYMANREKLTARRKARYEANREKCLAQSKNWYVANREKCLKHKKTYGEANREKISSRNKTWREANRERQLALMKAWRKANPEKATAHSAKRRAKKVQATPPWTTKDDLGSIEGFYVAASGLSRLAGCKLQVDHIIPLQGKEVCGLHVFWNLQLLTEEENIKKGNKLNVIELP